MLWADRPYQPRRTRKRPLPGYAVSAEGTSSIGRCKRWSRYHVRSVALFGRRNMYDQVYLPCARFDWRDLGCAVELERHVVQQAELLEYALGGRGELVMSNHVVAAVRTNNDRRGIRMFEDRQLAGRSTICGRCWGH